MSSEDPLKINKPKHFGYDLNTIQPSDLSIQGGKYELNLIQEGSESDQFWTNLGVNTNGGDSGTLSSSSLTPSMTPSRTPLMTPSQSFYGSFEKRRSLIRNYSSPYVMNMRKKKLNIHYGKGTESWYMKAPRFFKCDCSKGYFSVNEIENFTQYDLSDDCCIILDSNAPGKIYVWIGRNSSDVVRKLTQKSVEVWLTNINDGRWYDNSFLTLSKDKEENSLSSTTEDGFKKSPLSKINSSESNFSTTELKNEGIPVDNSENKFSDSIENIFNKINNSVDSDPIIKRMKERRERRAKKAVKKSDVIVEFQGEESIDFKSFFFGWSDEVTKIVNFDPGNSFTREMDLKRKQREQELGGTPEFYEPVVYELRNCNLK
jgi:hypothetical protein